MIFLDRVLGTQELNLDTMEYVDNSVVCCYGGGSMKPKAPDVKLPDQITPSAPVEEAGLEMDDEDKLKKTNTGKGQLKIPLSTASNVGLKV